MSSRKSLAVKTKGHKHVLGLREGATENAVVVGALLGEWFEDADEASKTVIKTGAGQRLAKQAVELARQQGRLTVFSMVDSLTRLSGNLINAGDRNEIDQQVGQLLALTV